MRFRSPINPPSNLGRRPPLDTVIYLFLRKTCSFLRETRSRSDYGSEGCRFNSYWVRHSVSTSYESSLKPGRAIRRGVGRRAAHPPLRLILCFLQKHSCPIIGFLPPICCRFVQLSMPCTGDCQATGSRIAVFGRRPRPAFAGGRKRISIHCPSAAAIRCSILNECPS